MTGHPPGVYDIGEAVCPETSDGPHWIIEGVARCPGPCGLYFDVEATTPELEKFIKAHDCAKEDVRYMPWQI